MKKCPSTEGNKNQQQQTRMWMLSDQLSNKNRNKKNNSNDFSMNQFSANIDHNGLVFSDENTFHQKDISNHMSNCFERDLTQNGIVKPLKHVRNSDVNGIDQVSAINQADQQNGGNHLISNTGNNQNTMASARSSTKEISLPSSHISRTQSELQLCKDISAAEWHDNCMFDRLVNGMIENQQTRLLQRRNMSSSINYRPFDTTDMTTDNISDRSIKRSLENIVRRRYEHMPRITSSPFEEDHVFIVDSSYCVSSSNAIEPYDEEDSLMFIMDDL